MFRVGLLKDDLFQLSAFGLEVLGMSIPSCKSLKQLYKQYY